MQVSPSEGKADEDISRDELAVERARLASELADAKRKFMAVAKRKQQEYGKKVLLYIDAMLHTAIYTCTTVIQIIPTHDLHQTEQKIICRSFGPSSRLICTVDHQACLACA